MHCVLILLSLCQTVHNKPVVILASIAGAINMADTLYTVSHTHDINFVEHNPIVRPIVHNTPAMIGGTILVTMANAWLANGMMRSSHGWERRPWWLPQSVSISLGVWGISSSRYGQRF